jgi:hypothetical protein
MDPAILVKRFVLRLKLRKQLGDAVQNCAAFLKYELNKDGQIIQGFAVTETGEKLQYYWVENSDGIVYDVCFEIARLNNPAVESLKYKLVKEVWGTDFNKDDHNQELFKLYRDEPSKFWKSVPRLNF